MPGMSDGKGINGSRVINRSFELASSLPFFSLGAVALLSALLVPIVIVYAFIVLPALALKRAFFSHDGYP